MWGDRWTGTLGALGWSTLAPLGLMDPSAAQTAQPSASGVPVQWPNQMVAPLAMWPGGGLMPMGSIAPQGLMPFAATPSVDAEAKVFSDFLGAANAALMLKFYDYLNANSPRYAQLSSLAGLVRQAAEAYQAKNQNQAFTLLYQAYRAVAALRMAQPDLPTV